MFKMRYLRKWLLFQQWDFFISGIYFLKSVIFNQSLACYLILDLICLLSEAYQQTDDDDDDGSTSTAQSERVLEKMKFGQLQHSKRRPTSLGERQETLEAER